MSHRTGAFATASARISARRAKPTYSFRLTAFIVVCVGCIVGRSAINIGIRHTRWREDLLMYTVPRALPSRQERASCNSESGEACSRRGERLRESAASVLRFLRPWPNERTAERLTDLGQWLEFAVVWVHTRTEFLGRLIGVDERWTMFSPSVGTSRRVVRAVLRYADGSTREVRTLTEPVELASFWRPFDQRRLQYDINLAHVEEVRLGWARAVAAAEARVRGTALESITLHKVKHALAPPGTDARSFWALANATPPGDAFWRYDVASGEGTSIEPSKARSADDELE